MKIMNNELFLKTFIYIKNISELNFSLLNVYKKIQNFIGNQPVINPNLPTNTRANQLDPAIKTNSFIKQDKLQNR